MTPIASRVAGVAAALVVLLAGAPECLAQKIPTPEEALGFKVGADFHLATFDQAYRYFKTLEQASPMLKVVEIGKTSMGRPMIYTVITSQANMAKIERYREITRTLSLVRGLTDSQARALAAEGKAVVYIDGGLHAGECAPAQHNIQLAYDLLTGTDPATRAILDNVILILVFANPDGMDLLAEWYHKNVGTPYETSDLPWPPNKYVGGDVNRDSYMGNMIETRHLNRIVNEEWFPEILYNHHQTAPFPARIWVHPASEPTNPNVHPLLVRWQNLLGTAMGAAFDRAGQDGAISRTVFDTWYPGYVTQVVDAHNVISLLTETALYEYATPHFYTVDDFPKEYRDFTMSTFYPSPWKGGWWRLRDAVDYCLTASKAVLQMASAYRQELLFDKYQMGRDTIARFKAEPPYGWIVPQQQWDQPVAAEMLTRLRRHGIEVGAAARPFVADGISYPAGTWVVPTSQPFGLFVKNLFEEQRYPDLTKYPDAWQSLVSPQKFKDAYLPPYDLAGWTVPYQMGVKAVAVNSPLDVTLTPVDQVVPPAGAVEGTGAAFVLSPQTNNSFIAVNRILKQGGEVQRSRDPLTAGGRTFPPGAYVVTSGLTASAAAALAKDLAIQVVATAKPALAKALKLQAPRVALYQSWTAPSDEGWTRWLFEQYEFAYTAIHDAEMRAGELRRSYDVLVIPSMSVDAIVSGHKPGRMPPQYVGGITDGGVRNVKAFVEAGGTLVLIDNATSLATKKLGIAVTDVLEGFIAPRVFGGDTGEEKKEKPVEFACPGSVLRMQFDPAHPIAFGMPEEAPAMFTASPAFRLTAAFDGKTPEVVAKYPTGSLLMSGYLLGESHLKNTSSVVDAPLGKGRVILLGFAVAQRGQSHGTFKLLFNSLYYGAAVTTGETTPAVPGARGKAETAGTGRTAQKGGAK